VFAVVPGKTYRFRIASVTSLSALNFEIEVSTFNFDFDLLLDRSLYLFVSPHPFLSF
jgi:hypothetical protein